MYYWEDNKRDDTMMLIDFAVVATHGRALLLRQPCVAAAFFIAGFISAVNNKIDNSSSLNI